MIIFLQPTYTLGLIALLGILFATLAGVSAYLITYSELARHFSTKEYPRKNALQAALVAFFFFMMLSIIVGFFLMN